MPALCFMPSLSAEELTAALEHRIAALEGALKQLEFSRKEIHPPETPEHVKELTIDARDLGRRDPLGPDAHRAAGAGEYEDRKKAAGQLAENGRRARGKAAG